jgi:hypothetical protein
MSEPKPVTKIRDAAEQGNFLQLVPVECLMATDYLDRLTAVNADLLAACKAALTAIKFRMEVNRGMVNGHEADALKQVESAIAKASPQGQKGD